MHWETCSRALLDRAVRRLRLGKLSFPYEQGFPAEYRSLIPPRLAVRDALRLEAVVLRGRVAVDLRPPVAGLDEAQSPIVPLVVGEPESALQASSKLAEEGFLVTPIRPPTVPVGTARLRFAFTAMHPDEEIARLADAVRFLIAGTPARPETPQETLKGTPKCPPSS